MTTGNRDGEVNISQYMSTALSEVFLIKAQLKKIEVISLHMNWHYLEVWAFVGCWVLPDAWQNTPLQEWRTVFKQLHFHDTTHEELCCCCSVFFHLWLHLFIAALSALLVIPGTLVPVLPPCLASCPAPVVLVCHLGSGSVWVPGSALCQNPVWSPVGHCVQTEVQLSNDIKAPAAETVCVWLSVSF